MKILFLGDYSNLHATLARELRRMGNQADVVSNGCEHMNVESDIYLNREKGVVGGFKYLYRLFELLPRLKGYDAVQLINTNFLRLRPAKIKYFYDRLKEQNGGMFLSLAGNDYYFCKTCYEGKIFRFSEFKIGDEFTPGHKEKPHHLYGWIDQNNRRLGEYIYENIDGAMAVLPEYDMAARRIIGEKLAFTNLPIDLSELPYDEEPEEKDKIRLSVGIRSKAMTFKGTAELRRLALEVEKEIPEKVETDIFYDLSFRDYLQKLKESDIVLDQLYAYSPAMNGLYTMAMGKVSGTGAQPEYYEYLGNPKERPVFRLSPLETDTKERLIGLIEQPALIKEMGRQSRELVKRHNDSRVVARKFLEHWERQLR